MKHWATFALLVFALHFGWEMTQAGWFASMQGLPFWSATLLCLHATAGDLFITAIAFVVAALVARSAYWPVSPRVGVAAAAFIVVGLAITAAYEVFAVATGRWRYGPRMPTILGIGTLPLLQWLIVPLAELLLFRLLWRGVLSSTRKARRH
ncbi:MAG: hypothetical protein ABI779_03260 [Acidobacteriota bacterium]